MSTVGFGLLKSSLQEPQPLIAMYNSGITESLFLDGAEKLAFNFIRTYVHSFGGSPDLVTVAVESGNTNCFENLSDAQFPYWVEQVQERHKFNSLRSAAESILSSLRDSHTDRAFDVIKQTYRDLSVTSSAMIADLTYLQQQVLELHDSVQTLSTMPGVSFGMPYLDQVCGGMQGGDMIVIAGSTSVGKTFLSLKYALAAYLSGSSVLYLSTEMSDIQIARRLLAMQGRINSADLKLGRLSRFGRVAFDPFIQEFSGDENFFKVLPGGMYSKIEDISFIVSELQPDLLVVDGAYLLRSSNRSQATWERIMSNMEYLKNLALTNSIPILATYQFNKKAPGALDGIAGSIAIGQLASIVLSLEYERIEDKNNRSPLQYRILNLIKGRDGELGKIRILFNFLKTTIEQSMVLSGYQNDGDQEQEQPIQDSEPFEVL